MQVEHHLIDGRIIRTYQYWSYRTIPPTLVTGLTKEQEAMCAVSMVMDYGKTWFPQLPKDDHTERERQLREFMELYAKARRFDQETGQPDCELDEKRKALKKIADEMGIKLKFL